MPIMVVAQVEKERSSFLKKRSKKLLLPRAEPYRYFVLKSQKFFGSFFQKRTGLITPRA
jgi:hypothetical protein